jgi:hypothetical protein
MFALVATIVFLIVVSLMVFVSGFRSEKHFWLAGLGAIMMFFLVPGLIGVVLYWFISAVIGVVL